MKCYFIFFDFSTETNSIESMTMTYKRSTHGANTLPQKYFVSAQTFEEETRRIFCESWLCVGRSSSLPKPGAYFLVQRSGESIIVTRDDGLNARAFYNVCRHRGTQLCTEIEGQFTGKIQCPYHTWTYSLDGD